ncbi:MAG: ABC transporter substrate-binding protein [Anaerolineae bacterium]|nr:ABC transporter substrate-binding protein [Anaerolineae bacterium]
MDPTELNRRTFLKVTGLAATAAVAAACAAAPTPAPTTAPAAEEPTATPAAAAAEAPTAPPAAKYKEAPALAQKVAAGELPPVEERLPKEPMVVPVEEEIGQYGGTWYRAAVGPGDAWAAGRLAYENLLRYAKDGNTIINNLAKSYEANEDGTEFTFYLREGMRWSDGEPFTADDFVFYYEDGLLNKDLYPTFPSDLRDPVHGEPMTLEKVDDYTIKITFQSPYWLFIRTLASYTGTDMFRWPKHYLQQFHPNYADADELAAKVKDAGFDNWWELFTNRRDWTNPECPVVWPFVPTRVPPDVPIVWERNPYYWKVDPEGNQLPYIDRIQWDVVENSDLLNLKALAGEISMQFRHILWSNYPLFIESAEQGDYRVLQWVDGTGPNSMLYFCFNHKNEALREIFNNRDFRIALSLGIQRSDINELAYQGMGRPVQATATPECPYSKEEYLNRWIEHDPDTANAMLDEMGLSQRDDEGFRTLPSGDPLTITVEYAPVFGPWRDCVSLIADQWKEIGIRIITKEEDRSLWQQHMDGSEFDMSVWTMGGAYNPLLGPTWWLPGTYAANEWLRWRDTKGERGEEPPPEVKLQYELYERIKAAPPDELDAVAQQFVDNHSDNIWFVGVVGLLPVLVIVKNNFRNVPEVALSDDRAKTPGCTNIEQYFIRSA